MSIFVAKLGQNYVRHTVHFVQEEKQVPKSVSREEVADATV